MSASTIVGAVNIQLDKFIAALMLSKINFSIYMISSTIGIGVIQIIYPILSTSLPDYINNSLNKHKIKLLNLKLFQIAFVLIFVSWFFWYFLGNIILNLYLQDKILSSNMLPVVTLLFIGSSFYFISGIMYNNIVSRNFTKIVLFNNVIMVLSTILLQPIFISIYGILGACSSWIIANIISILFIQLF